MKAGGMYARAGNNSYCIKRTVFQPDQWYATGNAGGAYFGNDNYDAPHSMEIKAKNVCWDCYDDYWDNGPNKGFCNSIFYSGEHSTVKADNSIEAPLDDTHDSDPSYTTIESGANITFVAGNKITLLQGFHAKPGSYFRAVVTSKKNALDTISNLFLVNETAPQGMFADESNDITFSAGENITLASGFIISGCNNHVLIKVGQPCGSEEKGLDLMVSDNTIPLDGKSANIGQMRAFENAVCKDNKSILVFPNPNNGVFYVECTKPIEDISVTSIIGKPLTASVINEGKLHKVKIRGNYNGIVLVTILSNCTYEIFKMLVN